MTQWPRKLLEPGRRRRTVLLAIAAVLVLAGAAVIVTGITTTHGPPQPAASAAPANQPHRPPLPSSAPPPQPSPPPVPVSPPVAVTIPAIGVHSSLLTLGLAPDGQMQAPPVGPDYDKAAWYKYSPTPGQPGPTVIEGHVDSAKDGPSVFYRLGDLRPGDLVDLTRADNATVRYTVDTITRYPKNRFPTDTVYGGTSNPQLRLITCGGTFDRHTLTYTDNIVVYGHQTPAPPPGQQP